MTVEDSLLLGAKGAADLLDRAIATYRAGTGATILVVECGKQEPSHALVVGGDKAIVLTVAGRGRLSRAAAEQWLATKSSSSGLVEIWPFDSARDSVQSYLYHASYVLLCSRTVKSHNVVSSTTDCP